MGNRAGCPVLRHKLERTYAIMEQDMQEILFSAERLRTRVSELAAEINRDYAGKAPIIVGILRGSVMFMADLVREINLPVTLEFMSVSSYGAGTSSSGQVKIRLDLDTDICGRDVILVEDILDSGNTLSRLVRTLKERDPASLKICVLLDKPARHEQDIAADYLGFSIPDAFVVGYGLDFDQRYRNLPYIGILKPSVYA